MPTTETLKTYLDHLGYLIQEAEADGVVLTIETVPVPPLAMGHYRMVASVRPARHLKPGFNLDSACASAMERIGVMINGRAILAQTKTIIEFFQLGIQQQQRLSQLQEDLTFPKWSPSGNFGVFSIRVSL